MKKNKKSRFSFLRQLRLWHCPHLLLHVVHRRSGCWVLTTSHAAIDQYLPPAGPTAANLPQQLVATERWDRRTDAQMTNSFILSHAQYACGAKNGSRLGNYSRETLTYLQLCQALVRDFCKNESKSCRQSTHRSALDCTLECCSKMSQTHQCKSLITR